MHPHVDELHGKTHQDIVDEDNNAWSPMNGPVGLLFNLLQFPLLCTLKTQEKKGFFRPLHPLNRRMVRCFTLPALHYIA